MKGGNPVPAKMTPTRIHGIIDDSGLAGLFQPEGYMAAKPGKLTPDQGIGIRPDGVTIGRNIKPWAITPHMVMVYISLGFPLPIKYLGGINRFLKVNKLAIPVIVMPGVLMIKPGQGRAFIFSTQRFIVPVGDHYLAIWIKTRDHQKNDLIQDPPGLFIVSRKQIISQLRSHLCSADFCCMEAH